MAITPVCTSSSDPAIWFTLQLINHVLWPGAMTAICNSYDEGLHTAKGWEVALVMACVRRDVAPPALYLMLGPNPITFCNTAACSNSLPARLQHNMILHDTLQQLKRKSCKNQQFITSSNNSSIFVKIWNLLSMGFYSLYFLTHSRPVDWIVN